jgi:hypothetical protein
MYRRKKYIAGNYVLLVVGVMYFVSLSSQDVCCITFPNSFNYTIESFCANFVSLCTLMLRAGSSFLILEFIQAEIAIHVDAPRKPKHTHV